MTMQEGTGQEGKGQEGTGIPAGPYDAEGCYVHLGADRDGTGAAVDHFAATPYAASGWGPDMQHGGPVAALMTRAMQRCEPDPGMRLSRITVEILGAIPVSEVRVEARVVRPGRRIAMLEAELDALMRGGGWRRVALARAWRLAESPTADVVHRADGAGLGGDIDAMPRIELPEQWRVGFVQALDWRYEVGGQPGSQGPTTAWLRLTQPLVAGEATNALQQAVAIADTANGVGSRIDAFAFTYLNTDLTIHLFDEPDGDWLGLRAESSVGPAGRGMSAAVLLNPHGAIGRVAQSLLIERRRR